MTHSVLLDTSFFIRLLNDEDPLHQNAREYFRYFLNKGVTLKVSTITIAEYCVLGKIDQLPLRNIQIIPFNLDHAQKAGEFARIIFEGKGALKEQLMPRAIIPNDSKLFAQADVDKTITHFVTSDARSGVIIEILRSKARAKFEFLDISTPYHQAFGLLDL
ncbi:type II toxin-antitoxin system VapC family toxin [Rufibacter ruber]|uniref:type II toxin-antitoxin system VapC family toxin n=1 Tax=Rufibacter ruber TaxID=1783499 RepID=UPI0008349D37|nr:hypothetical protein [Rufibacter ruber]